MAKIVMTYVEDGGVYKAFFTQEELDGATRINQSQYTIVDLPDADLIKIHNEKAAFKVTDGVLGVIDISPVHNKETYSEARERIITSFDPLKEGNFKNTISSFIDVINGIDIDSLTIDPSVSFAEYVKSINSNVYYDSFQLA
tara:strand:- start:1962 stop:2387 length:426 start_codon:yes stop_codon:yes gene_type:complete